MAHLVFVLALFMHGIGHVLFVANAWGYWSTEGGQGSLVSQVLHTGPALEGFLGLLWLVPLVGFLIGTWGFYSEAPGWHSWLLASATLSAVLLIVWWGSINTSSAFFALLFNMIVIAVVLWEQSALAAR